MTRAPSATLLAAIEQRYGAGRHYATAYLDYWSRHGHRGEAPATLDDILSQPAPASAWFEHAMTANQRGREFAALVHQRSNGRPGRFLDAACGFGERLVALAELGWDVTGVDVDLEHVRLAQANCRDRGLADAVHHRRALDAVAGDRGSFDVVAVCDGAERLADGNGVQPVVDLCRRGGSAIFEIGNALSLNSVRADRDFGLFGLSLLDATPAAAYRRTILGSAGDVPPAVALDDFCASLAKCGCRASPVDSPVHPPAPLREAPTRIAALRASFDTYRHDVAPRLPVAVNAAVELALSRYLKTLLEDWKTLRKNPIGTKSFVGKYLADVWTVVGVHD